VGNRGGSSPPSRTKLQKNQRLTRGHGDAENKALVKIFSVISEPLWRKDQLIFFIKGNRYEGHR
jgi:hypothetical protein